MPQAVDEDGNIWETDAAGNPVRYVGKRGGQSAPMTIGTPDPKQPLEVQALQQQIGENARKTPLEIDNQSLQNQKLRQELSKGPAPTDNELQMSQKTANLDALIGQINRVQELYQGGPGATKGMSGALDMLPTPQNRQFNSAAAGLAEQGLAAFRVPGVGSQSDTELRQFVEANRPSASDYDTTIEEKLRQLRGRVDATRKEMNLSPAEWQGADQTQGISGGGNAGTQAGLAQQGERFSTEADQRYRALAQAAFDRGAGFKELNDLAKRYGYEPYGQDLAKAIQFRNRGGKGAQMVEPQSGTRDLSALNQISATPVAEYFRGAANGATAGTLDEITGGVNALATGRPLNEAIAEADLKKQIGADAFPMSNIAGNITGGIGATLAGGAGMRALGVAPKLGRAAPMLGDLGYGAAYGAGENNDNRLLGAGMGGAMGVAGGVAGRNLIGGAGRVMSGAQGTAQQFLRDRGVGQTIGQTVGGALKTAEDKMMSMPVVGDMVAKRRMEGMADFNGAAFRELFPNVTEVGPKGLEQASQVINQAYSQALSGVNIPADPVFKRGMGAAIKAAMKVPGRSDDVGYLLQQYVEPNLQGGVLTGDRLQAILQGIAKEKAAVKGQPRAYEYGQAIDLIGDAVMELAERGSPGTAQAVKEANRLYAGKRVLENAVLAADGNGGLFTPQQLSRASINNTKKFGGAAKAAEGSRPFYELTKSGQEVLPSKVPNSGTADRILMAAPMLPAAAGGGLAAMDWIDPQTAAAIGALGLPFTKAGQRAAVAMLTKRPPGMSAGGDVLKRNRRLGGLIGAPLLGQNSN